MSSNNASSTVTYTSVSSDSNRPSSWGIPLESVGEILDMNPYEEVAQQGQAHPLSPAYVHDPMELDEHVPLYALEPEHPEHLVPADDDSQAEDQPYAKDASPIAESPGYITDSDLIEDDTDADSIDYPDEPGTDNEDEDPEKEPNEEHEPEKEDAKEDESSENSDETEPFKENETAATPPPPRSPQNRTLFSQIRLCRARKTVRLAPPMSASMDARIAEHAATPIPPTSPTYDQAPLAYRAAMIRIREDIPEEDQPPQRRFVLTAPPPGCDVAESSVAAAARAPRDQYDFVDAVEARKGLIRSPGHDAPAIAKAADKAEDVGYVRALQDLLRWMDDFNRGSHFGWRSGGFTGTGSMAREMMQATFGWRLQTERYTAVSVPTVLLNCQPLNFKGTEGIVGLSQWIEKMESVFHISGCAIENQVKFATCILLGAALTWWNGHMRTLGHDAAYAITWGTFKKKLTDKYCPNSEIKKLEIELWNLKVRGNDVAVYTQRFQELALMCTKFLADETAKIDKYIGGLPDNIHGNVMSARPKTLDFAIELANDLMDQKLHTYAERQNENKRKADDLSRNNHQQQPHKKQNVARAYTTSPGEKKAYTGNLPLCTKHMRRDCPKLKNRGNGNGNDTTQGRAYSLGGRDASPDSNIITGTFLLNNRYAKILFDTGADRSFVSSTFSALIDITPTTLENHYDVELADGKIIRVNTIIWDCTLNFMNHPFNVDLMRVPLGSFDVIIGMDWLTKYHGVIICD
ncbi:reverse transcriptase domain-containing protein [Tanacetum coccineum]